MAPNATWSSHCGRRGSDLIAGYVRPMTSRSSAAMSRPAAQPPRRPSRCRRSTAASTVVQPADMRTWTAAPATTPGRSRRPGTSVAAARVDWRRSPPVASASSVDGRPLSVAAATPAVTTRGHGPPAGRGGRGATITRAGEAMAPIFPSCLPRREARGLRCEARFYPPKARSPARRPGARHAGHPGFELGRPPPARHPASVWWPTVRRLGFARAAGVGKVGDASSVLDHRDR
jgi:hypothetical protein